MIAKIYQVPSSSGDVVYEVDPRAPYCTCPAYEFRPGPCKHILAVRAKPNRYPLLGEEGTGPGLFTVGHSNHDSETFVGILNQHSIAVVVDVRSYPTSKWQPQFWRYTLEAALLVHGIDYLWWGRELGGRTELSVTDPQFQQRMAGALRGAQKHRLALMCSEGKPEECHRAWKLSAFVHRLPEAERVPVKHILRDGGTIGSVELESGQKPDWLWKEFAMGGS